MILLYVFLTVVALYFLWKSRGTSIQRKRAPGPKGLPLLGCALEINESNIVEKFFEYAEKYGNIFEIKLLHQTLVSLNSEEVIRKALSSEPYRQFMNDKGKIFYGESMLYGCQSVFTYNDSHSSVLSEMRKGIIKGLHVYGQEGFNIFEKSILQELDRLNKKIESSGGRDIDIMALLKRSLTNVISLVLRGEVLDDDDKDVNMFWDYNDGVDYFVTANVNNLLTMLPILKHAPGIRSKFKNMRRGKEILIQRCFNDIKNQAQVEQKGLVGHMLELQRKSLEEGKEVVFTDERIISNILETVAAGILTTWSVMSSTFLCLVNNAEYQDKVFKEVFENIGSERLPLHSDKINYPHVEALELEVHRFMTVVPILTGRICTRDINLEGYDIAKGSLIMANVWHMHHDPKIWGDPWTFRPERFLDTNGQLLPRDHAFRKNWISFGTGRRQCLGEQFARSRYFLYMATLFGRWKFVGSPGKFGPCDPRNMDNIDTNITLRPKPFFCYAEKRY